MIDLSFAQRSEPVVDGAALLADGQVERRELPNLIVGVAENGLKRRIGRCVAQVLIKYADRKSRCLEYRPPAVLTRPKGLLRTPADECLCHHLSNDCYPGDEVLWPLSNASQRVEQIPVDFKHSLHA